jgi:GTP-binding protein HflX
LRYPEASFVSALTGEGLPDLFNRFEAVLQDGYDRLRLLIPHDRYDLVARLHREGGVHKEETRDEGTYLVGTVPERILNLVQPYVLEANEL